MAKYGPTSIVVEYDNASDVLQNITQYVQTINGIDIEQVMEEARPFGAAWDIHMPIGVGKMPPIELGGIYDDTVTTGPHALLSRATPDNPSSATRTLKITWGGAKTTAVETHVGLYSRRPDKNTMTRYLSRLQPTGAVTEV